MRAVSSNARLSFFKFFLTDVRAKGKAAPRAFPALEYNKINSKMLFKNCSEGQTNVPEHFPRISENFRRLPNTFEEDQKMFRLYTNEFKYNLRDKLDISEIIDIFTCEDIISLHVRISYRFYQFITTRYTTGFYIMKDNFVSSTGLVM